MTGEKKKFRDFAIAGYNNFSWCIYTEDWSYIDWLHEGNQGQRRSGGRFLRGRHQATFPGLYADGLALSKEDKDGPAPGRQSGNAHG